MLFLNEIIDIQQQKPDWSPGMDNTYYIQLLAEAHQDRLREERSKTRFLRGQPRVANPALRKVIHSSGGFLVRAGEALEGIAGRRETSRLPSNGSSTSTWKASSLDF